MKNSKSSLFIVVSALLVGCQARSPEQLANESCECYIQAKTISNTIKKLEKIDECYIQMQSNLTRLEELAKQNDWPDNKLLAERNNFINAITKEKNATQ